MGTRSEYLKTTSPQSLLAFNGERTDPMLDGYHLGNGYRLYSPVLRRFTSPDNMSPFGAGGINPYTYCEGDPINHTDPTGHFGITDSIIMLLTSFMSITPESSDTEAEAGEIMEGGEEQSARHRLNPTVDTNDNATVNNTDEPTPAKRARLSPAASTSSQPQMMAGPSGLNSSSSPATGPSGLSSAPSGPNSLHSLIRARDEVTNERSRSFIRSIQRVDSAVSAVIQRQTGLPASTSATALQAIRINNYAVLVAQTISDFMAGDIQYDLARNNIDSFYNQNQVSAFQNDSLAEIHRGHQQLLEALYNNQQAAQQLVLRKQEYEASLTKRPS